MVRLGRSWSRSRRRLLAAQATLSREVETESLLRRSVVIVVVEVLPASVCVSHKTTATAAAAAVLVVGADPRCTFGKRVSVSEPRWPRALLAPEQEQRLKSVFVCER